VNDRKFVNQFQPQTLYIATVLLYINAVFAVLGFFLLSILFGLALAAGGYGIANEKRWGYGLGVAAAVLQVVVLLLFARSSAFGFPGILTLMFDVGLVALLLHPESRQYQRIWFK
jgi:energy-coupling factor transporter transmembrane protein EcfT